MKKIRSFWSLFLLVFLLACQSGNHKEVLYQSDAFTLTSEAVMQGEYLAKAISENEIHSNYKSHASANFSRLIQFKFSINEKDNELPIGVNHWLVIGKENHSPIIRFGEKPEPLPNSDTIGFLPPNYRFRFQLDFSPVLDAFNQYGFYTTFDGQRIAKEDFKGVYLAGNSLPLSWDFVNLSNKGLQFMPSDSESVFILELRLNPYDDSDSENNIWKLKTDLSEKPRYQSPQLLVDALFNMAQEEAILAIEPDRTLRTGAKWSGVWTRDISYSIFLAFAIQEPAIAMNSLRKKVNQKGIIQDTGSGGAWPISSDRTTWALAAWELFLVTGNMDWLRESYQVIRKSLEEDWLTISSETGLMKGESSFLDWREQSYPKWADNADIYHSENLGTNAVHFRANQIAAQMALELGEDPGIFLKNAEQIKQAIRENLWLDEKGYFASFLYGRDYLYPSDKFETLGEALSILFEIASDEQAARIMKHAPLTVFGATCFYPPIPGIPPYHNDAIWPFVQAYWNWAAAKTGNAAVVNHGLAALYRPAALFLSNYENMQAANGDYNGTEINSHRMLWSIAGNLAMVYRVFIGMEFTPEGIHFQPFVTKKYMGKRSLENFVYRDATLSIRVEGFGKKISGFYLDGKKLTDAFFPANLSGEHEIFIQLDNGEEDDQALNLVENHYAPTAPTPKIEFQNLISELPNNAVELLVYRNGKLFDRRSDSRIEIPLSVQGEFVFVARDEQGWESFLSEPMDIIEPNAIQRIELENHTKPGDCPVSNFSGSGFIDVSTTENLEVDWEVKIERAGEYRFRFRYSNGTGPWNTDNNCAIRSLYVNDSYLGIFVFPQRGDDEWSDWGFSNQRKIWLDVGTHRFRLSFDPWNANMDGKINEALLDYFEVKSER